MEKLIITNAITGAELQKKDLSCLPVTPDEQGAASAQSVKMGASIIHLHVRDDQFNPSQTKEHFERSVRAIRAHIANHSLPQPIIQFSTGGAVGEDMSARIRPLELGPEMASFNLGTMNFGSAEIKPVHEAIFINTRYDIRRLSDAFRKFNVIPEFEVYDLGHLHELDSLISEGKVNPPFHIQFVLGVPGGARPFKDRKVPDEKILNFLISQCPKPFTWAVAGIGAYERPLAELAIGMGGHVRVGLEDNIYFRKGQLATSNAELVDDIRSLAKKMGREIATPSETRTMLGLDETLRA